MFRFEHPEYFFALLLLPLLVLLYRTTLRWRTQTMQAVGNPSLIQRLITNFSPANGRRQLGLLLGMLGLLIVSLANPQVGSQTQTVRRTGIDILIALDVSRSMLATDIQPNRLERAKQWISRLVEQRTSDRIGIIVFAGNAYLQLPLTTDYAAVRLFLQTISTDIISTQGTAVGKSIDLATKIFANNDSQDNHPALIVLSDGEDHEAMAVQAARQANKQGISIFSIGVGTARGSTLPVIVNGRQVGVQELANGEPVVSKLNETTLREIAAAANGNYYHLTNSTAHLADLTAQLDGIEKRQFEARSYTTTIAAFSTFCSLPFCCCYLI